MFRIDRVIKIRESELEARSKLTHDMAYRSGFTNGYLLGKLSDKKDGLSASVKFVDETPPDKDAIRKTFADFVSEKNTTDVVNHPAHYTDGKIEVIDFIEDKKLGFCLGNAVKYIARAGKKDPTKEVEDLKKARWYIERRIKELEEVCK